MPSTTVWYCCQCGFGPCNDSIDYFCPNCQVKRCYGCETSRISNRCNYGLPGEAEVNPIPEVFAAAGFNTNTYNKDASLRPFNIPQKHHEKISEDSLRPPQGPPTCLGAGDQHSTGSPSISDIFQHGGLTKNRPSSYYYCCQCRDGPKLYDLQPVCINCDHKICRYCEAA